MESTEDFKIDIVDFNDGHFPGGTSVGTKIAKYVNKQKPGFFSVFDEVLPDDWSDKAYDYAVKRVKPWGSYITTEEALSTASPNELWEKGEFEKAIALVAVQSLVVRKGGSIIGKDINNIHGTAVWCLTSGYNDEVQYHMDYAELYRYETNIIYPPIYAGTCQVAPVYTQRNMKGGEFKANVQGIDHYAKFGYKCKHDPIHTFYYFPLREEISVKLSSKEAFEDDLLSSDWLSVPYKHNRGIFHDGDFPHFAAEVTFIEPHLKRVILGLNCFPKDIAECNIRAPEHSDAFNRTIKLYQRMAACGLPITSAASASFSNDSEESTTSTTNNDPSSASSGSKKEGEVEGKGENSSCSKKGKKSGGGISIQEVMKNPTLAKLLVQAAKRMKDLPPSPPPASTESTTSTASAQS